MIKLDEALNARSGKVRALAEWFGLDYTVALLIAENHRRRHANEPEAISGVEAYMTARAVLGERFTTFDEVMTDLMMKRFG